MKAITITFNKSTFLLNRPPKKAQGFTKRKITPKPAPQTSRFGFPLPWRLSPGWRYK